MGATKRGPGRPRKPVPKAPPKKIESRPGPGGTTIYKGRAPAKVKGVPATEKQAAASRVNALKHGGSAKLVTVQDALAHHVDRTFGKGSAEVGRAYYEGLVDGDNSGIDAIAVRGLSDLEMIRRGMVKDVAKHGAVLREAILSPTTGEVLGERRKLHPGVEGVAKYSELLGFTSEARRLDPRSRGEGSRDDAFAAMLRRDALLRSAPKDAMCPPADDDDEPIEVEFVSTDPNPEG